MLEYMFMPFRRYADFKGRSRRAEFWWFSLFCLLVYAVLFAIMLATGFSFSSLEPGSGDPYSGLASVFFGGFGLIIGLFWLATIIPTIAVTVRRLHDRDMSGWWYLGFIVLSFVPFVGIIASIALLVIMFLAGTPGPNRFGPDPKDPSRAEVFA